MQIWQQKKNIIVENMGNIIKLTPIEEDINELIQKSGFYLQTYRAIDALSVLNQAEGLVNNNDVIWQLKAEVYRNIGQAQFQMGHFDIAMEHFIHCYEITEDGNDKAAAAGLIAGNYLRAGNTEEALIYADKALQTATAPELLSMPYRIQGVVAANEGNYSKGIELLNKAAELSENAHCLTDLAMTIIDISAIYIQMGMLETALSEVYRAERYVKECRNLDLYFHCAIRRAKLLFKMGKDIEAKALIMALDDQKN